MEQKSVIALRADFNGYFAPFDAFMIARRETKAVSMLKAIVE